MAVTLDLLSHHETEPHYLHKIIVLVFCLMKQMKLLTSMLLPSRLGVLLSSIMSES